jgi:hypothetical protein
MRPGMDRFESGIGPRQKEAKPAAGLTDATDHDRRALHRRRSLFRSRQGSASDHDTIRVVGREFGGNAPPDDAVATYDENSLSIHAVSPR